MRCFLLCGAALVIVAAAARGHMLWDDVTGGCATMLSDSDFVSITRPAGTGNCTMSFGAGVAGTGGACIGNPANDMFCSDISPDGKTVTLTDASTFLVPIKASTPTTCDASNEGSMQIDDDNTTSGLSYTDLIFCADSSVWRPIRMAVNEVHTFTVLDPTTTNRDLAVMAVGMGRPFKMIRLCCEINAGSASIQLIRRENGETVGTGTNMMSGALSCSTASVPDGAPGAGCTTTFVSAEQTIDDGHKVAFDITAASGVSFMNVMWEAQY